MDITKELAKNFPEILKVAFETERKEIYLRVEVGVSDLQEITKITRRILQFIDEKTHDRNYFVDVYSSGTEKLLDKKFESHVGKRVKVKLLKPVREKLEFEGVIERESDTEVYIRWNAKGQMRLQAIAKENIETIKLTAKL